MTSEYDDVPPRTLREQPPRKIWSWLVLLVVIAVGAGVAYAIHGKDARMTATAHKRSDASRPMPVLLAQATQHDVNVYIDALGTVTPRNAVTVKTRIDGQLMKLYFREGQTVKAGDLLAEIDPRPYEVQLAQAAGQLAKDKAALDNALTDLERYKTLWAQDSIARQQVDTQEALVRQTRAAIAVDQGQVDNAKLQLTYCRITAPISGRVGLRQVDPGNMVHASDANGLVTITQLQPITVLYTIPEDNLPKVTQRMKVGGPLVVDAYDKQRTAKLGTGALLTLDNQIDTTTGTIKLRAEFKNDDNALFPNQFVNTRMLVDVRKNAVVVPTSAVQSGRNGSYVYVIKKDDTVELRQVKTGVTEGEIVAIEDGLAVGESVVADGVDKLRDGVKVKPIVPGEAEKGNHKGQPNKGGKRHRSEA